MTDPAMTVPCPQCEVPAGMGCIGKRGSLVHAGRRAVAYARDYPAAVSADSEATVSDE